MQADLYPDDRVRVHDAHSAIMNTDSHRPEQRGGTNTSEVKPWLMPSRGWRMVSGVARVNALLKFSDRFNGGG